MISNLIDGISIKLNQVFGNEYKIYSENVTQGLKEPCFFISVLNPSQSQFIGSRYFWQHPFDIHYFPAIQSNNELQEMATDLFAALEYITLINGDVVHGTGMNYEVIDGVLHFFVNYNMFVRKVETLEENMESMESIETITGVKE